MAIIICGVIGWFGWLLCEYEHPLLIVPTLFMIVALAEVCRK